MTQECSGQFYFNTIVAMGGQLQHPLLSSLSIPLLSLSCSSPLSLSPLSSLSLYPSPLSLSCSSPLSIPLSSLYPAPLPLLSCHSERRFCRLKVSPLFLTKSLIFWHVLFLSAGSSHFLKHSFFDAKYPFMMCDLKCRSTALSSILVQGRLLWHLPSENKQGNNC